MYLTQADTRLLEFGEQQWESCHPKLVPVLIFLSGSPDLSQCLTPPCGLVSLTCISASAGFFVGIS